MAVATDATLHELVDKQALYELVVRYCRAVDRADEELLRSVYHDDAVDEHGYFTGAPDEFVAHLHATSWNEENIKVRVQHALTNWTFELHGDVAYGESYIEVRDSSDGELAIRGVARYVDRYERRDGEWRIVHRRVVPDWLMPGIDSAQFAQARRDRSDSSYERV